MNDFQLPSDPDSLVHNCMGSGFAIANAALSQLPETKQIALKRLILAGGKLTVSMELSPVPSIVGNVEANGKTEELFSVRFPDLEPGVMPDINTLH
jgi:hypothetical protein